MNVFVTGSNGFLGYALIKRLSADGHRIKCLVRSADRFAELALLKGTEPVIGDVFNSSALEEGANGADLVFHLAAYTKPWSKEKDLSRKINVDGTRAVLDAALKTGVRRFVYTSSAGVIGPSNENEMADEKTVRTAPFFNEYESDKSEAEKLVLSYSQKGMEVVIVLPTRVYGPGPENESNSVTRIIRLYEKGFWRFMPGDGSKTGNYVFIDDVVNGFILAAEKGRTGERYILGGENLTFTQMFEKISAVTGRKRFIVKIPLPVMTTIAGILTFQASLTGIAPPLTPAWVKKYLANWSLSSNHAITELGYSITSFDDGTRETLRWIHASKRSN